jgi:hypothetical protein
LTEPRDALAPEVSTFTQAIRYLAGNPKPSELPEAVQQALAQPLNTVVLAAKGQAGLTRDALLQAARAPYVAAIRSAARGDLATLVLAADAVALNFGVGRVVVDAKDPSRLQLLPLASAPPAFVQLLALIVRDLRVGPAGPGLGGRGRDDPGYA